ncbi:facilitated trehalose transporter Tret1-like [Contarinia nasturtii]|uniref:facilitated trehalose transporter Tret1-like n=2 Tax=Contarinia nasturtii TaxID=265458 RepID=UPI0012D3F85A|nr:facilitated trehalose transporter Tret1-like [Contarinia nasturtii]
MEESGYEFKNVANQYWATIAANLIMLGHGCVVCWFTPSIPILMSEKTPLISGPLTNDEMSWLGSINNVGALGGIFTFGYITSFFGCKRAMIFLALPSIAFWILIYFGNTYYHILFARCFAGFVGGGIQTVLILFVSEISNDNIRGRLSSFTTLSRNVGVLIIFTVGAYVDYHIVPCILIFLPILYLICFTALPNTPQFYLQKGNMQAAENSLRFYKGFKAENQLEINAFNKEFERLKSLANKQKEDKKVHLSDFFEAKAMKGLFIGITLAWLSQFPGSITFLNYAVLIFEKSGPSKIDPYTSSIISAIAQIIGCFFSAKLADSLGRKLLMIISFLGSATGLFVYALYLYLIQNGYSLSSFSWLPVTSVSFIMFISSAGIYTLYSVCFIEYLPSKIRTIGLTICVLSMYISAFIFVKMFPIILTLIDLYGCMIILMVGCVVAAFFVIFVLDETKGQTLDTIQSTEKK